MKKFNSYEKLKQYIDFCGFYTTYLENELSNFLSCIGSDNGYFTVEIENKKYEIQVISEEVEEDTFEYTYILNEI